MRRAAIVIAASVATGIAVPGAGAAGSPSVAALQVALARQGLYAGTIDGVESRATTRAVRRLQARDGLVVDGIAGPRTRRALGPFARRRLGDRVLRRRAVGFDVAELQFELAWHGFPSGVLDGRFGIHVFRAVRRFQRFAGLPVDGVAGTRTLAALAAPLPRSPLRFALPVDGTVGDRFGPRGDRFHAGVDFPAPEGTPVRAAGPGRVAWAAPRAGWGLLVAIAHRDGVRTLYAHLSEAAVRLGERVETGAVLGRVGATGDATGPHLHFEVRVDGAAVDPLTALPGGQ